MQNKVEKKLTSFLLAIQFGFILLILSLFLFSNYINKKEMAEQITLQVESYIKEGINRDVLEVLASAQLINFNAVGYYYKNGSRVFSFPNSLSPTFFSRPSFYNQLTNGIIEVPVYFDSTKTKLAGHLKFSYQRMSYLPYAIFLWLISLSFSMFLFFHYKKVWLKSIDSDEINRKNLLISKLVDQVNHDIRSPLQTLFAVVDDSDRITDQDRSSILSAIDRIRGITDDLKTYIETSNNSNEHPFLSSANTDSFTHFASSTKQICEEKFVAYRERGVRLVLTIDSGCQNQGSKLNEATFQRILSNLIRNSYESLQKKYDGQPGGVIELNMSKQGDSIQILIKDNGVGIPEANIDHLRDRGFTFGKDEGSGLGLHYVYEMIEFENGSIEVESEVDRYTAFKIILPSSCNVENFGGSLNLAGYDGVLVIDDDKSVFERWKRKLKPSNMNVIFESSVESVVKNLKRYNEKNILFLVDQEIRGSSMLGLDFVVTYGLERRSILVTNNYNSMQFMDQIRAANLKLIPKPMIEELCII